MEWLTVESQALCQSSATPHTQMCYKINVIHTTGLNSKAKSKKKRRQILTIRYDRRD